MNAHDETPVDELADKIEEADARLARLEAEIEEIGQPAAQDLKRRLEALKVEERALKRNFEESQSGPGSNAERMEKIESLLRHIEKEESSVEHAVAFLHQGAPSTVVMAVEAGAKVAGAVGRKMKRVLGEQPLGSSVFVNHSHDDLVSYYGLKEGQEEA